MSTSNPFEPEFKLNYIRPQQIESGPPCISNCPSGGVVREWIGFVAQRNKLGLTPDSAYKKAWERITTNNPFPAVMGRICPHPCESACNRIPKDGAVSVSELERYLGDWAIENNLKLPLMAKVASPKQIGVIGAGPAGLSFAYQMARRGHTVTVYDEHPKPGGMLRYGIPDYRLPPAILDAEIKRIVDLGVVIQSNTKIGRNESLESIRQQHDLLFLGIGAQAGRKLGIPGEDGHGVFAGIDYLSSKNNGKRVDLGSDVIVVGGGNTAIDAARTARRSGANVTILYRRTRAEMPAIAHEIDEALEEGVEIRYLSSPVEICRDNDSISAVVVQEMELREADASGRRSPAPNGTDPVSIPAHSLIVAASQYPELDLISEIQPDSGWISTDPNGHLDTGIYAGGDVRELGIASAAIGHGRAAAEAAQAGLEGRTVATFMTTEIKPGRAAIKLDFYESNDRVKPSQNTVEHRLASPEMEVSKTISEPDFLNEASRCLSCESCFGCQNCITFCNAAAFMELGNTKPGKYYGLDLGVCEGCGKCIEVCPCGFLNPQS